MFRLFSRTHTCPTDRQYCQHRQQLSNGKVTAFSQHAAPMDLLGGADEAGANFANRKREGQGTSTQAPRPAVGRASAAESQVPS